MAYSNDSTRHTSDEYFDLYCNPCFEAKNLYVQADFYCEDCTQYLCFDCCRTHSKLNVARDHKTVRVEDMPASQSAKPPRFLGMFCSDHKFQLNVQSEMVLSAMKIYRDKVNAQLKEAQTRRANIIATPNILSKDTQKESGIVSTNQLPRTSIPQVIPAVTVTGQQTSPQSAIVSTNQLPSTSTPQFIPAVTGQQANPQSGTVSTSQLPRTSIPHVIPAVTGQQATQQSGIVSTNQLPRTSIPHVIPAVTGQLASPQSGIVSTNQLPNRLYHTLSLQSLDNRQIHRVE